MAIWRRLIVSTLQFLDGAVPIGALIAVGLALLLGVVPLQRAIAPAHRPYHPWWEIPGLVLEVVLLFLGVTLFVGEVARKPYVRHQTGERRATVVEDRQGRVTRWSDGRLEREVYGSARLDIVTNLTATLANATESDSLPLAQALPSPSAAEIVSLHLRDAAIRQRGIDTLTNLLNEGQRTLASLEASERKKQFAGNAIFITHEWSAKADDAVREEFGAPDDSLMRSEPMTTSPPDFLSEKGIREWQEADRRLRWIRSRLQRLSEA